MDLYKRLNCSIINTPYYANRKLHIINEDFSNFPILHKHDILTDYPSFLSKSRDGAELVERFTSGSSGEPFRIIWNSFDLCNSLFELWKIRKEYGITPSDKYVSTHISFNRKNSTIFNKVVIQKNNLSLSKAILNEETFMLYYDAILEFSPKWLMVSPSFIYEFIVFLNDRGLKMPSSIVMIELTGEYCTRELFNYFLKAYPLVIWKVMYGMQEFNAIAYGDADKLSVLKKNVMVEIVSDHDSACLPFEEGHIVVSGLKNTAMPLIRYYTGDFGYIDKLGLLHITKSRSNDNIIINNNNYDGSIFWAIVLEIQREFNLNILKFQVRLKNNTLYIFLKALPIRVDFDELVLFIKKIIKKRYAITFDVVVSFVDSILPETNKNKIKYFINEDIDN